MSRRDELNDLPDDELMALATAMSLPVAGKPREQVIAVILDVEIQIGGDADMRPDDA